MSALALRFSMFAAFARVAFLSMLTYRLRFYTGIVTYLIYVVVYTSIWKAVHANPESSAALREFGSFRTLFTYFAIGWLARSFCFNNIDRDLAEMVETGQVAGRIARPVSLHFQLVSSALGEALFRLVCFSPLIAAALFLCFDMEPPASAGALGCFALALLFAVLILAEVNFLVGLLSFWTQSIQGIMRAKQFLIELLSGLLIPLSYFPAAVQRVAQWTPFPTLTSTPNRLYLGLLGGREAAIALLTSFAWWVALAGAARLLGRAATKSLTIQGG